MVNKIDLENLEEDICFCEWARERAFKNELYAAAIEWSYEIECKKRLLKQMRKQWEEDNK